MSGSPITAIDHLRITVASLAGAAADYAALLGTPPGWQGSMDGAPAAVFAAGNLWLCLVESAAPRGLEAVALRVDNAGRMARRLARAGIGEVEEPRADPLAPLAGKPAALRMLDSAATGGLALSWVERRGDLPTPSPGGVAGLDHLVISSADGTATAFLLAAQLGLDMRLDMRRPEWGVRLMFFRCGDLILEVMQRLADEAADGTGTGEERGAGAGAGEAEGVGDRLYGLSWRVADAHRAHARLLNAGFDLSSPRSGRKPGTTVFTVRSRTAGVPTLMLEPPAQTSQRPA